MPFAIPQQTSGQQPKEQSGWEASRQQQYRQPERSYGQQQRQQAQYRQPQYMPQPRPQPQPHAYQPPMRGQSWGDEKPLPDYMQPGYKQPPIPARGSDEYNKYDAGSRAEIDRRLALQQQSQWGQPQLAPTAGYGGTWQDAPQFLGMEDEDPYNRRSLMGRGRY